MKRLCILILFSLSLALSLKSLDATIAFEAYIAELVEKTVISDAELLAFAEKLDKGELVNPIECETAYCSTTRLIHSTNLEDHLSEDIDLVELKAWVNRLLVKRGHERKEREEIQKDTKVLWKHIPSRLSVGSNHACAVNTEHKAICWGKATDLQRNNYDIEAPPSLGRIVEISAGSYHTCALEESGAVQCWGENDHGQTAVPPDLGPVLHVFGGGFHTCAVRKDRTVRCWGSHGGHKLTSIPNALGAVAHFSVGTSHNCAVKENHRVQCWGNNFYGPCNPPSGLGAVAQISAGEANTCALDENGFVTCWGNDRNGELKVPLDLGPAVQISAGNSHVCALTESRMLRCWGASDHVKAPKDLGLVLQVSVGHQHVCVLEKDGLPRCWSYVRPSDTSIQPPSGLRVLLDAGTRK